MLHPETHIVKPDEPCIYCKMPVGHDHKADCVSRKRTVVIRVTAEYTVAVPESWNKDSIEFHRNEGSRCAGSTIDEMKVIIEREPKDGTPTVPCGCEFIHHEFVREATAADEWLLVPDHGISSAAPKSP